YFFLFSFWHVPFFSPRKLLSISPAASGRVPTNLATCAERGRGNRGRDPGGFRAALGREPGQGGPGVACRRRIRHKLMLGLGVVIAVIGLLTGGTALGLRSYQLTIRNFESKLAEIKEANELCEQIRKLANPGFAPSHVAADAALGDNLLKAEKELQDYQDK